MRRLLGAGERKPRSRTKPYNAYILVYVAKNESSKLLADNSPMVGSEATGDRDQLLLARSGLVVF